MGNGDLKLLESLNTRTGGSAENVLMDATPRKRWGLAATILCMLFLFHAMATGWEGTLDGPGWDEVGHFAAGMDHWRHWRFELFSVNPPLVRLVAFAPFAMTGGKLDPAEYSATRSVGVRPEFGIGSQVAKAMGSSYFPLLGIARYMCIPFSLLAGWVCYRWTREIWGVSAGIVAMVLWFSSPTVLTWGHFITPDLGAAAVGVTALYCLRSWLLKPTGGRMIIAGFALGLAELTKMTWLVLIPLYPILWLLWRWLSPKARHEGEPIAPSALKPRVWRREGLQVLAMLVLAWWVLNLGYGFEGTFKPLGEFQFISSPLGGHVTVDGPPSPGNRFVGTWMGRMPVPVPENYLIGIDYMKWEFEHKEWSYLDGQWRLGGWWYYYIMCLLYKEPMGTWMLFLMAVGATGWSAWKWLRRSKNGDAEGGGRDARVTFAANGGFREELLVLLPCIVVFAFLSSQTGFNHHLRYALVAFPFFFIWIAKVGRVFEWSAAWGRRIVACLAAGALGWSIASSLSVFPHHFSYFNELAGGPYNGWKHLDDSNLDWGQDLLYVKGWYDQHPKARPFHLMSDMTLIDPKNAGIDWERVPIGPQGKDADSKRPEELGPQPGWYCVSNKRILLDRAHPFDYFKELTPVEWVGYTMPVYHITVEQANALRRKYGLPEVTDDAATREHGDAATGGR